MIENVRALLDKRFAPYRDLIADRLCGLGYEVRFELLMRRISAYRRIGLAFLLSGSVLNMSPLSKCQRRSPGALPLPMPYSISCKAGRAQRSGGKW